MTETEAVIPTEGGAAIAEALDIIDAALLTMTSRELVSSGEVSDLLLDVRTVLAAGTAPAALS